MITITHTRAGGTICEGTARGDGSAEILKANRFRWSRNVGSGAWYVPQSRDRACKPWQVNAAAGALRAAGHDVTVTIDEDDARPFAEAEAERYERAEDRAERMAGYAGNAAARSTAAWERARQMGEAIPFGQPVMPDHHSYRRDMNYRDRMHALQDKSITEGRKADHFAHRAASAETTQAGRENVPVTLRRIAKLEAEQRRITRNLEGRTDWLPENNFEPALVKPSGAGLAELERRAAEVAEQLGYWRGIVAEAQANGVRVWSAADVRRGDFVRSHGTWAEVLRVNPKSVTVAWGVNFVHLDVITQANARNAMGGPGWTSKLPYDKIREHKSAAGMADHLTATAAAERAG